MSGGSPQRDDASAASSEAADYAGVDPGEAVAPIRCSACGGEVQASRCVRCGVAEPRRAALLREYGPEILVPGATPKEPDLSGVSWVAEGVYLLLLGFALFLIVRYVFGGWDWRAMLFSFVYWGLYALARRRSWRAAVTSWSSLFRIDETEGEEIPKSKSGDGS